MVQSWKILAHSPSLAHFIQWPVYSGSQITVAGEGLCKVGQADRWTQQRVNISNNGILRPLNLISIFFNVLCSRHYGRDRQLWARRLLLSEGSQSNKHLKMLHHCPFWGVYLYKDCQVCFFKNCVLWVWAYTWHSDMEVRGQLSEVHSCLPPCQSRSVISVAGSFQEISTLVHVAQITDTCHHILLFLQILGFEFRSWSLHL